MKMCCLRGLFLYFLRGRFLATSSLVINHTRNHFKTVPVFERNVKISLFPCESGIYIEEETPISNDLDMSVYENRGLWRKSLLPHQISKNIKKISHQPRRNFFLPQFVKNLSRKWSVFVRIFYKNNLIFY
jgi:hypothetical protein